MNPAVKHMQRLWTHESGMRWYLQSREDTGFVEMCAGTVIEGYNTVIKLYAAAAFELIC